MFLEGRNLKPSCPLPSRATRVLHSVLDMRTGECLYDAYNHGSIEEPCLGSIMNQEQSHPWLLTNWIIVNQPPLP